MAVCICLQVRRAAASRLHQLSFHGSARASRVRVRVEVHRRREAHEEVHEDWLHHQSTRALSLPQLIV